MPDPSIIGVHLDFKGVMFKDKYIPQLLRDLARQKVNTVLVEYEDVFPYEGIDIAYDKKTRWSCATLNKFRAEAKKNNIEIIPLVQCLGHLEYLMGWDRYRKFAENYKYPSTIRVDDPGAVALICEMLRQVMAAHPESRYIHLGMDEAHALRVAAKRLKRPVLHLWLDHLRVLMKVVEPTGKMPYVWTDMLEDNFEPGVFDEFRGKVIFGTWDYCGARGDELLYARLVDGFRVSRQWLNEPENPGAPAIHADTKFVEDYPPAVKRVAEPYRNGRHYRRNFQIDLWSKLGMQCLPASAIRISANLSIMPPYNDLAANLRGWSRAVARTGQMGQIGTSWARGGSWCPPNFSIDLQWPLVGELARSMGAKPMDFFPGVPPATVDRIIRTLGRCRLDWRLEGKIADEMEELAPGLREHRYEWQSIILMARTLELQRRADFNIAEVDFFTPNHRPVDSEWQRRIDEQNQTLKEIAAMQKTIIRHFGQRYHGDALHEWVGQLFDMQVGRIKQGQKTCRKKLKLAKKFYARR